MMLLRTLLWLLMALLQDEESRWIEQLGSDSVVERDAAQAQLRRRIGSEALRARLEKLPKEGDPERAARVRDLLSWFGASLSEAGVALKLAATARPNGAVDLVVTLTSAPTVREGGQVADPKYWNNWKYFVLDVLREDGSVVVMPIKTTRTEEGFYGLPPAKVPLVRGEPRQYSDGRIEGLTPGTYRLRVTAKAMEGAKGYEGRPVSELPAPKGAADVAVLTIPPTK
jgi:hypothetical protein